MAVRLSALRAGRPLPPRKIPGTHFLLESATVRLEELGQMKNPMTSSGTEPVTFRLAALCLNQLRHRVTPVISQVPTIKKKRKQAENNSS
jgi:hypothetical protein